MTKDYGYQHNSHVIARLLWQQLQWLIANRPQDVYAWAMHPSRYADGEEFNAGDPYQ